MTRRNFHLSIIGLLLLALLLSCSMERLATDKLGFQDNLEGKWKAKAFDGALYDTWHLTGDGWMQQQGFYIEKGDTVMSAITSIQKVGNDIILFSVIQNSNPKIFKATKVSEEQIIFENDDYRNPFKVDYEFIDASNYRRTITGYEGDSLVNYIFEFKKID